MLACGRANGSGTRQNNLETLTAALPQAPPMALDRQSSAADFVEDVPDDFLCPICLSLALEPHLIPCCGQHFCRLCSERLRRDGTTCPMCKSNDFSPVRDKFFERKVNELRVKCPASAEGCDWVGEYGQLANHAKSCVQQITECEFAFAGCTAQMPRKRLEIHMEENTQTHLSLMASKLLQRDAEVIALTQRIKTLEKQLYCFIRPADMYLTDFDRRKLSDERWRGPPFYTHLGGYKMCLVVDANGTANGKGTHVSVFVYLMAGEHDDELKWPMRAEVTIQMCNQRNESYHWQETVHFNDQAPPESTERVVGRNKAPKGRGRNQFALHSKLGFDEATNCQYLKDDTLRFRVSSVKLLNY